MSPAATHTLALLSSTPTINASYVTGMLALPETAFSVVLHDGLRYHGVAKSARLREPRVRFEIEMLKEVAKPAAVKRGGKRVVDESFRKSLTISAESLLTPLVPEKTMLMEIIRRYFLKAEELGCEFNIELHELEIYEKGSFFKSHRRAVHGDNIFGSLILTYPAAHSGGALALYPSEGDKYIFDTGAKMSSCPPYMAYAMFRGDVNHEVLPVTSGHRITLLYDLSWVPDRTVPIPTSSLEQMNEWTSRIQSLLDDETVLPDGGLFCFGIEHSYPVPSEDKLKLDTWKPYSLQQYFRGTDRLLLSALDQLGLDPEVQLSYELLGFHVDGDRKAEYATRGLANRPLDMTELWRSYEKMDVDDLVAEQGTIARRHLDVSQVVWITPVTSATQLRQSDAVSDDGKYCFVEHVFANFCVVAPVKPYGERRSKLLKRKSVAQGNDTEATTSSTTRELRSKKKKRG
ncbi:unnamed protein product [Peniophora sp. CBMAI 1063]|nr:unnamed protein product [Peniophora sp. CBMAI 1063]